MTFIDQINELRAELTGCALTRQERASLEAEFAALVAERDAREALETEAFAKLAHELVADRPS